MTGGLLSHLKVLADSANTEELRGIYRAQWAAAMARLGQIGDARTEINNLRTANRYQSPRLTAWVLVAEGLTDHFESLSGTALGRLRRAQGLAAACGDDDAWSCATAWIAASEYLSGNYEAALRTAVDAILRAPKQSLLARSRAHLVVANCLEVAYAHSRAATHYQAARACAVEAQDISMQSAVLYDVAAFRIARVSLDEAFGSLDDSEASRAKLELESASNLDHGLGVSSLTAMIPILRAQLLLAQSKWAEAGAIYAEAVPVASIHGQGRWAARFLAEHSHCEAMLGKCESARALAERALSSLATSIDVDDAAACHARIARAFLACGIEQEAEEQRQIANELRTKHREVQTRLLASFEPILQGASVI